ncbi:MAG TPA: hypothetical protein VLK65_04825 [Vicinamibacteria bacterium]|nr:hypothetical protein [Vicinamibacteria bacterium]
MTILVVLVVLAGLWLLPSLGVFFASMRLLEPRWPEAPLWLQVRTSFAAALLAVAMLHWGLPDGWPWSAFPALGLDDTEFSSGYSAMGFWQVRLGMRPEEVIARIGRPLQRDSPAGSPDLERWFYTRSPNSSHYRIRTVIFREGQVVERQAEYYLD